ncbi:GNAT family N-acetyltransferase [Allocoleopsis franciscana]|uniref:Acetyltransferase n=1 Tax=Allocoleopsis franciscana PCC 7113 TaxID=1173027 RepID=K9WN67_9CYAN|nr:GNAT family N-acetyltransferase [Allocoleopsis franciscana]AFZ21860.1 acetyltransferase [Allocoleopsis franciscana PCC 7113]
MDIAFKIADYSDIEILVQLIREFHEIEHLPFDESKIRPLLAKIMRENSLGQVWLIQDSGEAIAQSTPPTVLGYIVLTFGYSLEFLGRDAFIDELYIRESHRGQGVGTRALQFVQQVCPSLGIQALHLEVARKNTAAKRLYRKVGFEDHDRYLMTQWMAT